MTIEPPKIGDVFQRKNKTRIYVVDVVARPRGWNVRYTTEKGDTLIFSATLATWQRMTRDATKVVEADE